jgi:hypothetical protein
MPLLYSTISQFLSSVLLGVAKAPPRERVAMAVSIKRCWCQSTASSRVHTARIHKLCTTGPYPIDIAFSKPAHALDSEEGLGSVTLQLKRIGDKLNVLKSLDSFIPSAVVAEEANESCGN